MADNSIAPSFIDLFCGCGGFTLGMQRAGFRCLAAIDSNKEAVGTLRQNLVERGHPAFETVVHALKEDLTAFSPHELARLLGSQRVDVIVGGPPCQGFSTARHVDGSNNGVRLKEDSRRRLYRHFLDYVDYFQPRVFVIENVLGLRTAAGGRYFTAVQHEARNLGRAEGCPGYRVHSQIENAIDLGVPQKRRRQLIIGVRADVPGYFPSELLSAREGLDTVNLGDAICDLPRLEAGEGTDVGEYDFTRRRNFFLSERQDVRRHYLFDVLEIEQTRELTNHSARAHSARDLRDFARLREGESSAVAMKRGVKFEFPYDKTKFKDRYTRQSRFKPCSTIVAHLSKDGLMFIHPTQNRSLTPREAARVQSFPDWFRFPKARTHAFRLIGNAVPPLIAEAIGLAVKKFLRGVCASGPAEAGFTAYRRERLQTHDAVWHDAGRGTRDMYALDSRTDAARELERLARLDRRALLSLPTEEFLRGWHALLFLFPGLHPDNALDHGEAQEPWPEAQLVLPGLEETRRKIFARSGWPVALELIGREAWRRYEVHDISADDFYCVAAQRPGLCQKPIFAQSAVRREEVSK